MHLLSLFSRCSVNTYWLNKCTNELRLAIPRVGFPGGDGGKEPTSRCRRLKNLEGWIPGLGRDPHDEEPGPLNIQSLASQSHMWLKWLNTHASSEVFILFAHACSLKVIPHDFHFRYNEIRGLLYRTAEWPWASRCTSLGFTYFTKGERYFLYFPNFRVISPGKSWNKSCFIFHKYSKYLFCYSDIMRHIASEVEIEQFYYIWGRCGYIFFLWKFESLTPHSHHHQIW